jgi:hypothetical protein
MATWRTPKTNWQSIDKLLKGDINRIEENLLYLAEREPAVRQMLANAITAMGRSASASETYQQLATKIRQISNDANAQPEDVLEGKTFYSGGTKKTGVWPGPMFGTGELGHFNSYGDTSLSVSPGELVVQDYKYYRLNEGHTIRVPDNTGIRALIIRSWSDIIINGTIDLDSAGGYGDRYITIGGVQYDLLGGLGGNGGDGGLGDFFYHDTWDGKGGTDDCGQRAAGGMRGGGGGGGGPYGGRGGDKNARADQKGVGGYGGFRADGASGYAPGGQGTYGAGGGGGAYSGTPQEIKAGDGADAGINLLYRGAGGGGGGAEVLYGGCDVPTGGGGKGGGGVLILIAAGNVIINGLVTVRGGRGGDGSVGYGAGDDVLAGGGGGGGGSGGGKVLILRRGSYTNNGTIDVSGGSGGSGARGYVYDDYYWQEAMGKSGSPGQPGSVQVKQLL